MMDPRLAAIALLYLEEEDAFWCLTAIVEVFMPRDYYTKTLLGSQVFFFSISIGKSVLSVQGNSVHIYTPFLDQKYSTINTLS